VRIHFRLEICPSGITFGGMQLEQQLDTHLRRAPQLAKGVYVARGAMVVGDVTLGEQSSVWYNAVLRADINRIIIGHHSNIQDNVVVHLEDESACVVGNYVTVGHSAILHACTIGDETLIGMGSVILDRAKIGKHCLIGAKALVPPGAEIPDGSMVLGIPGKVVRQLTPAEREKVTSSADKYARIAAYCLARGINVGSAMPGA
jgi:gamma-carbonic anhydrase